MIKTFFNQQKVSVFTIILLTILFMIMYVQFDRHGIKRTFKGMITKIKRNKEFRWFILLAIYVSFILYNALIKRGYYEHPFEIVNSAWKITGKLDFNNQPFCNLIMMIPFPLLLINSFRKKLKEKMLVDNVYVDYMLKSVIAAFSFSLFIELSQAVFHLGTFQISDLVYNTIGGIIGGGIFILFYYIGKKLKR